VHMQFTTPEFSRNDDILLPARDMSVFGDGYPAARKTEQTLAKPSPFFPRSSALSSVSMFTVDPFIRMCTNS